MKYLLIIRNRAILISFIVLSLTCVQAQKNTDSPYSRYGIGLQNEAAFNGNFGSGGAGIAWRPYHYKPLIYDSLARSNAKLNDRGTNFINPVNPASFSNISLTTFEASLVSKNVDYKSGSQSRTGTNTQLGHMALAFPIGEKWGVGFGLRPFSSVGYDYAEEGSVNGNEIQYTYEGSGGVNEIFVGTAVELIDNLSIGVSGKFLFGSIEDNRRVVFTGSSTNFFNTLDQREVKVRALSYQFGVQYVKELKNDYRVLVGAIASPVDKLNAERTQLIRNYTGGIDLENFRDTALFIDEADFDIAFAPQYGIGFAIEKKLEWILNVDFKSNAWGGERVSETVELNTSHQINIGYEKYTKLSGFGSYLKRIGYRAGVRYNSSLVTIDNEDVQEFGISFGISMPLRKSFSTLNMGVELGRRGKDDAGLTQEDFINFQFGVTINDKWFIQRKYD